MVEKKVVPGKRKKRVSDNDMLCGGFSSSDVNYYGLSSRFVTPAVTEIAFSWWYKQVHVRVSREAYGHGVIVDRVEKRVWRPHVLILLVLALLFDIVCIILGMDVVVALLFYISFGFVCSMWILFEDRHMFNDAKKDQSSALFIDAEVWEHIKLQVAKNMEQLDAMSTFMQWVTGQSRNVSVGYEYDNAYNNMQANKNIKHMDDVYSEFIDAVSTFALKNMYISYADNYRYNFSLALSRGRGVKRCGCVACCVVHDMHEQYDGLGAQSVQNRRLLAAKHDASVWTYVHVPQKTVGQYIDAMSAKYDKMIHGNDYDKYVNRKDEEEKKRIHDDHIRRAQAKYGKKKKKLRD